jgi:hypothetical protein
MSSVLGLAIEGRKQLSSEDERAAEGCGDGRRTDGIKGIKRARAAGWARGSDDAKASNKRMAVDGWAD